MLQSASLSMTFVELAQGATLAASPTVTPSTVSSVSPEQKPVKYAGAITVKKLLEEQNKTRVPATTTDLTGIATSYFMEHILL